MFYRGFTFRQLVLQWDSKLLSNWDHTAVIQAQLYNLTCVVINAVSKSKVKPRSASHFHPYRKKPKQGLKINQENFTDLRMIGNLIMRNK